MHASEPGSGERLSRWHHCGVSVRGPLHIRDGLPNQDSCRALRGPFGKGFVVCDGLGSKRYAAEGARFATLSVADAVRIWSREPAASDEQLLRLIHNLWNMKVNALGVENCATTCLFAVGLSGGDLLIAQLGDGIVLAGYPTGPAVPLKPERTGFSNTTTGLGIATSVSEWQVSRTPAIAGTTVILATDGVSDDILPDCLDEFVRLMRAHLIPATPQARQAWLRRELRNWSTPGHLDDKTLAMLWLPADTPADELVKRDE
jgi:serine/threonine protein phosphatase PrpC